MKAMRMYAEANQDHGLQFDKQFIPVSLWLQFWLIMTLMSVMTVWLLFTSFFFANVQRL